MNILIIAINKEKFPEPVFPIGASYISFFLKKSGYNVSIFDCCLYTNPEEELKNKLKDYKPDIIGISIRNADNNSFPICINYLDYYKEIILICRNYTNAKIVLGGSGYSIFPELYLKELNADFGICGEGEYIFADLINKIKENINIDEKILRPTKILNINYDDFPDREGFDIDYYYKYSGCLNVQTKRGCPFKCIYCTYPLLEGSCYRLRTPEKVVDEIEYWKNKKNIEYFFFVDNVFNDPEDYAKKICLEIIKRKLKIKWTAFFIPKIKDKDFFEICKESGLSAIDFGTDVFSEIMLESFKKNFTVEDIFYSCDIAKKCELKFNHSLIFGGPDETYETMQETINNVNKTEPTAVIAFIGIRVYPNTEIANYLKNIEIGLNPVFYISESVKDNILDFLKENVKDKKNWVVPGLEKGTNQIFIKKLREKNIKGPIWEALDYVKNIKF